MDLVPSGIYRHFKGSLYFVMGTALDREDHKKPAEVIYHALYGLGKLGWQRGISPERFLEEIERPGYSGPRFTKIMDWKLPNILPGQELISRKIISLASKPHFVIVVYEHNEVVMVDIDSVSEISTEYVFSFITTLPLE